MEIDIANDGRAFYIELDGRVQMWNPTTRATTPSARVPVTLSHENGLLGIQLAQDFDTSGYIYLAYSAMPDSSNQNRVSRFKLTGNTLGQEQIIYTWQHQRQECCHTGGSLEWGANGDLYISTGDNTNPFAHGFNPTDERPGRAIWDAQRTSANTNDPNGKILRIRPIANATGVPGVGTTYTIPQGNMFPVGTAKTLPEIYAMGFRNPFRINYDKKTGWILMGDYGPDAGSTNPNRGPQGSVEWNVVKQPGFYGWPYCIRENVPYKDIDYTSDAGAGTVKGDYNCAAPVNDSPNNTGLTNLPAAIPASMWMGYSETDTRFPDLGTGGAPMGGARYYYDEASTSEHQVPAVLRRPVVHRRVEQRLDPYRGPQQPGPRHRRVQLGAHHGLHQPDGHGVRPGRLAVRRRVGPGLRGEQRGLGRLPRRLHQRRTDTDRQRGGQQRRCAGRHDGPVLVRRLQRPGRHRHHLPVELR